MMFPGASCVSQENLWRESPDHVPPPSPAAPADAQPPAKRPAPGPSPGRGGRKMATRRGGGRRGGGRRLAASMDPVVIPATIAPRVALPRGCKQFVEPQMFSSWQGAMPEYVPGRDTFVEEESVAMGYTLRQQGKVVLSTGAVSADTVQLMAPFVLAAMQLHAQGELEPGNEGRYSAGPLNLSAYLAHPPVADAVDRAVERRQRRNADDGLPPGSRSRHLPFIVHVHPDGRRAYIGEETDRTRNGEVIMSHNKSFKSLPIRSWTGGAKVSDMPGGQKRLTQGKLCLLPVDADLKERFIRGAEAVWRTLAASDTCSHIAQRMLELMHEHPIQACSRLGDTGFNAYSINLDYRTGTHTDGKNWPGTMSALVILETGPRFCGGFYMLPQFHVAISVRQGTVLFHRSGDPDVGLHGNSEIHLPDPSSHRIAVVLYQTKLHTAKQVESETARALGIPPQVLSLPPAKSPSSKPNNALMPAPESNAGNNNGAATGDAMQPAKAAQTPTPAASAAGAVTGVAGSPLLLPPAGSNTPAAAAARVLNDSQLNKPLFSGGATAAASPSGTPGVCELHGNEGSRNGRTGIAPAAQGLHMTSAPAQAPNTDTAAPQAWGAPQWPQRPAESAAGWTMSQGASKRHAVAAASAAAQIRPAGAGRSLSPQMPGHLAAVFGHHNMLNYAHVQPTPASAPPPATSRPAMHTAVMTSSPQPNTAPSRSQLAASPPVTGAMAAQPAMYGATGSHAQPHARVSQQQTIATTGKGTAQQQQHGSNAMAVWRGAGADWSQDGSAGSGLSSSWVMHVPAHSSHGAAQHSGSDSTPSHRRSSGEAAAAIPSAAELDCSIADMLRVSRAPTNLPITHATSSAEHGQTSARGVKPSESHPWPPSVATGALVKQSAQHAHLQPQGSAAAAAAPAGGASARWDSFMTGTPATLGCWSWQARQPPALMPAPLLRPDSVVAVTAPTGRGRVRASGPVGEGLEDMQQPAGKGALPAWGAWRGAPLPQPQRGGMTQMYGGSYGSAGFGAAVQPFRPADVDAGTQRAAAVRGPGDATPSVHAAQTGPWGRLPVAGLAQQTGAPLAQEQRIASIRALSSGGDASSGAMHAAQQAMHAQRMHAAQRQLPGFDHQIQAVAAASHQMLFGGSALGMQQLPGSMHAQSGGVGPQTSGAPRSAHDEGVLRAAWSGGGAAQLGRPDRTGKSGTGVSRASWADSAAMALTPLQQSPVRMPGGLSPVPATADGRSRALTGGPNSLGAHWDALMEDGPAHSMPRSSGGRPGGAEQTTSHPGGCGGAGMTHSRPHRWTGHALEGFSQDPSVSQIDSGSTGGRWHAGHSMHGQHVQGSMSAGMTGQVHRSASVGTGARRSVDGAAMMQGGVSERRWSVSTGADMPRSAPPSRRAAESAPSACVVWPYEPAFSEQAQHAQHTQHTPRCELDSADKIFGSVAEEIMNDPKHQAPVATAEEAGPWGKSSPATSHQARWSDSLDGREQARSGGDFGTQLAGPRRVGSIMSGRALPAPPEAMQGGTAGDHSGGAMKREHTARSMSEGQPAGKQAKQQATGPRSAPQHSMQHARDSEAGKMLQRQAMMATLRAMRAGSAGVVSAPGSAPALYSQQGRARNASCDSAPSGDSGQHTRQGSAGIMHAASMSMPIPSYAGAQQRASFPAHSTPAPEQAFYRRRSEGVSPSMHAGVASGGITAGMHGMQQLGTQPQSVRPVMAVPRFRDASGGMAQVPAQQWDGAPLSNGHGRLGPGVAQDRSTQQAHATSRPPQTAFAYSLPDDEAAAHQRRASFAGQLPLGSPPPAMQPGHVTPQHRTAQHSTDPQTISSPTALPRPADAAATTPGTASPAATPGAGGFGGQVIMPKAETPETPPAAAAAAGDAAAAMDSGKVRAEAEDGADWPWAPGTVLNIDQEKWKALMAEQEAPAAAPAADG